MYFWRVRELKSKLVQAPLTDREVLPYIVASSILVALIPAFPPDTKNIWDYTITGWGVLLAIAGTIYLYRMNGGATGAHFLRRYFAIGWVAIVRWAAVVVPLGVLLDVFLQHPEQTTWHGATFLSVSELILYERIGHHINDVAKRAVAI